jgi:hypothetical protein
MLFALWDERAPRPTQDVDFLAFGSTELDDIAALFREIVETPVTADGLDFQPDSIRVERIREADTYGGVRVRLLALLGKGEITLQIDLGSGDVVTPAAEKADFPTLLDFPAPRIRAYPIYTVVAEKFEAMVKLGITNSRMKDFFDVWFLSRRFDFDGATLQKAIHATFARRQTTLGDQPPYPLTDDFARDATKQTQWGAFLSKNGLTGPPLNFGEVVGLTAPAHRTSPPAEKSVRQMECHNRMAARPTMTNPLFNYSAIPAARICHGFASKGVFDLFSIHLTAFPFLF